MAKKASMRVRDVSSQYSVSAEKAFDLTDVLSDLAKAWGMSLDAARARCLKTGIRREAALARHAGSIKAIGTANKSHPAPGRKAR
jgi:hypothetical protein